MINRDIPAKSKYYLGVDLGQANDYTAISILEKKEPVTKVSPYTRTIFETYYYLRHLERPHLGTPYPVIVDRVKDLLKSDKLRMLDGYSFKEPFLIVDATGVGRPVVDLFKQAKLKPVAINITGGNTVHNVPGGYNVPKRDLITNLQVLFQNERLKIAKGLREGQTFVDELINFKLKVNISTGHDSYEAWREGIHDDLVLSVALAAWYAEKGRKELKALPPIPQPLRTM